MPNGTIGWQSHSKKGLGVAHRWANKPNLRVAKVQAPGLSEPAEVAEHHRRIWANTWHSDQLDQVEQVDEIMKALRAKLLAGPDGQHRADIMNKLKASNIRRVARTFKNKTAIGFDQITFQEIAAAPQTALEELEGIMQDSISRLALPHQALANTMAALGKQCGGARCIAVAATYYRLLMAIIRPIVREWDRNIGSEYDSALVGRSPIYATAQRAMIMEQASLRGLCTILILWDLRQFFDSIDLSRLIPQCVRLGFPEEALLLGLQAHRAPRILKMLGTHSQPIEATGRSILAGCTLSTSLARAYLRHAIGKLAPQAGHMLAEHVDDMDQLVVTSTTQAAIIMIVEQALALTEGLAEQNLNIAADKTIVLSNRPGAAGRVAKLLRQQGIDIKSATRGEDLGVSTVGGHTRTVASATKRAAKATTRASRVGRLARANPRAAQLFQTGVRPQQAYDLPVLGAGPQQLKRLTANCMLSIAPPGTQACSTTTMRWRLGRPHLRPQHIRAAGPDWLVVRPVAWQACHLHGCQLGASLETSSVGRVL